MQTLNAAIETVPKDRTGKLSKEYLRVALDVVAPSAGLPPLGAVEQVHCQLSYIYLTIFVCLIRESNTLHSLLPKLNHFLL